MANVATLTAGMTLNAQGFFANADKVDRRLGQMQGTFGAASSRIQKMFDPASLLSGFVGGMAAGITTRITDAISAPFRMAADKAGEFLSKGIAKAMDMEQVGISMEVMLGSQSKAAKLMGELGKLTGRMGGIDQFGAAQSLMGFGVSQEKLIPVMQQIGNIAGGNAEKFGRIALQYGQVMSKGKLLAEDLNIIAESGVNLREVLATQLGVSVADIAKLMQNGAISAQDFAKAIETLANTKYAGMLDRQSETMKGLIERFDKAGEEAGRQFATGFAKGFDVNIKDQSSSFVRSMEVLNRKGLVEKVGSGAGTLYDKWLQLTPLGRAFSGTLRSGSVTMDSISKLDRQREARANAEDRRRAAIQAETERYAAAQARAQFSAITSPFGGMFGLLDGTIGSHGRGRAAIRARSDSGSFIDTALNAGSAVMDLLKPKEPNLTRSTSALVKGSSEAFEAMIAAKWGPQKDAEKKKTETTEKNTKALSDLTETIKKGARSAAGTITSFLGGGG